MAIFINLATTMKPYIPWVLHSKTTSKALKFYCTHRCKRLYAFVGACPLRSEIQFETLEVVHIAQLSNDWSHQLLSVLKFWNVWSTVGFIIFYHLGWLKLRMILSKQIHFSATQTVNCYSLQRQSFSLKPRFKRFSVLLTRITISALQLSSLSATLCSPPFKYFYSRI